MKARILLILCLFLSLSAMGQGTVQGTITRTCPTCGKARPKCKYKGKHPTCSVCKKIIGAKTNGCAHGGKHPAPEAAGYDVTFSCNVSTAALYIDGSTNGTANGSHFLKTGSHSVRATADGYKDYTGSITVNRQNTAVRITMEKKPELAKPVVATTGTVNGHEWVDLGLPSGTKWATMNVGATSPSDYGYYFAWGETSTKSSYDWDNLKYWTSGDNFDNVKYSKYVMDSKHGTVDGKMELDPIDDAAYVNWGSGWRMPSIEQVMELKALCKWTWTTMDRRNGYKVVGSNGNSIFLPAAGNLSDSNHRDVASKGRYWSRTLSIISAGADYLLFFSGYVEEGGYSRSGGLSVRAVWNPE